MYFYLNKKSALEAPPPPSQFYTMINYDIISYMGLP